MPSSATLPSETKVVPSSAFGAAFTGFGVRAFGGASALAVLASELLELESDRRRSRRPPAAAQHGQQGERVDLPVHVCSSSSGSSIDAVASSPADRCDEGAAAGVDADRAGAREVERRAEDGVGVVAPAVAEAAGGIATPVGPRRKTRQSVPERTPLTYMWISVPKACGCRGASISIPFGRLAKATCCSGPTPRRRCRREDDERQQRRDCRGGGDPGEAEAEAEAAAAGADALLACSRSRRSASIVAAIRSPSSAGGRGAGST